MKNLYLTVSLLITLIQANYSQCTPPRTDNCEDALALCSLDELNGYTCQNVDYSNPTACLPCNGQGGPHNSSWWAFVTEGGLVSITISITNCILNGNGLQFGLVSACDCSGQIACQPNCSGPGTYTIQGDLQPCKIYYLWVDGCSSDVCTFTLTTAGGSAPKLGNLSAIKRSIPDSICVGCCSDFWIDPQASGCIPEYVWTMDGIEVASGPNERVSICFPNTGKFSICVEAVIGNPSSGSFCDSKTECTNVVVKKYNDASTPPITICANQTPYKWHCQAISKSGIYKCPFLIGCCKFDSVLQITVLDSPKLRPNIYFIGCNEKYTDPLSKIEYSTCQNGTEIIAKKSSNPNLCDSTYLLYAVFPSFAVELNTICTGNQVYINPTISKLNQTCLSNEIYTYKYSWYKSDNPNKIISDSSSLKVDSIAEYCLQLSVNTSIGNSSKTCEWTFCKSINFTQIISPYIIGTDSVSQFQIESYTVKIPSGIDIKSYHWRIEGGSIINPNPSSSNKIEVIWNNIGQKGKICLSVEAECVISTEFCLDVFKKINTSINPNNFIKETIITILPNPNNGNFIISWDKNLGTNKLSIINAEGKEIYETKISKNHTDIHIKDLKLKPGIYYARISSKNKIYTKAFIVQ